MLRGAAAVSASIAMLLVGQAPAGLQAQAPLPTSMATLAWERVPDLPAARSGHIAGLVHDRVVVLGGSDFPVSPFEGGTKTWYADGFVLAPGATRWQPIPPDVLAQPLAYAVAVPTPDGLVVAGGSDDTRHYPDAFLIVREGDRLVRRHLPPLPRRIAMAGGAAIGRRVYVLGGQDGPASTHALADLWRLDLAHPAAGWQRLPAIPGGGRILPAVGALGAELVAVSGAALAPDASGAARRTYLTDTWRYREGAGWQRAADAPWPVVAAPAVPWGQSHLVVLGGDDGAHAAQVQALRDRHPGFRRDVLAYHLVTDTWVRMGTMPAGLVTTTAVRQRDEVLLLGGEDRPGHRSPMALRATLHLEARRFGALDYLALTAYLLPLLWIGRHFAGRVTTREEFFLGGRRVPWWAAGLSIYATQLSAITFLAIPAKAYAEDWTYLPGNLSIVLIAPVVIAWYLPRYRALQVTTAYEYLEHRFNLAVRLLCSGAFIALQWARMAIVLYLPALALAAATGIDVYASILVMGVLCTAYTLHGGMHAVIWTDVLQAVVLLGAVGLALALVVAGVGGQPMDVWRLGAAAGKLRLADWTPDLTIASVWVVVIGNLVSHLVPYTADQAVVQRYLTTRDERQAARAVWLGAALAVPGSLLFFAVGTALYAFYRVHPGLLNPASPTDATFSWFIAQQMPPGVSGLVVSGVFAAAMSTLSSSINSIVTALITDFADRLGFLRAGGTGVAPARHLTLLVGLCGTASALVLATWDVRSLWDVFLQSLGLFGGGLAGVFALGIFTRRAHGRGALIGLVASAVVLFAVQRWSPLHFLLYAGIGTASAFGIGWLASVAVRER